jgi:Zn-dependent peptidase ImmA (M78 family)/DNA-binding XRE family transcriptional regulator
MSRFKVSVTPSVLVWAREQAGLRLDDAARIVGVSPDRLQEWENGEDLPTLRQVRLLGKAYHRPSAFFLLRQHPPSPPQIPDFRLRYGTETAPSPQLIYEIRRAISRRDAALEILAQLGEQPPAFGIRGTRAEGATALANRIRGFLGVSLETQRSWTNPYEALRLWITAVERAGVLVFHFSDVDSEVARGFSLAERPLPVIAINGKDSPRGRIFTVFHELAHVTLNLGGLCDLHDRGGDWIEPFCNQVAAEALVPSTDFIIEPAVSEARGPQEWSDQELRRLSNRYMVSREVILRRLLSLGKTTRDFYEAKRGQFLEEYRRSREEGGGFLEYYRRILRDNGAAFTSLLLDAYRQEAISARDLSHHLGDVKLTHVENIAQELSAAYRA